MLPWRLRAKKARPGATATRCTSTWQKKSTTCALTPPWQEKFGRKKRKKLRDSTKKRSNRRMPLMERWAWFGWSIYFRQKNIGRGQSKTLLSKVYTPLKPRPPVGYRHPPVWVEYI